MTTSADGAHATQDRPLVLTDVIRELEAIADAAEAAARPDLAEASRRARSLISGLRHQFVFEITGPALPSETPVRLDRERRRRRGRNRYSPTAAAEDTAGRDVAPGVNSYSA